MEYILGLLVVLSIATNVLMYILFTGKFARIDTRTGQLKTNVETVEKGSADLLKVVKEAQTDVMNLKAAGADLVEEHTLLKSLLDTDRADMQILRQDLSALQLAAATGTAPVLAKAPVASKNGRTARK